MSFRRRIILFCLGLPVFAGSSIPGIENFVQVDDHVYRGAQPDAAGFAYLAKLGVKTILDLREADGRSLAEKRTVEAAGMHYVNVPMTGLTPPTEAEIAKILILLEDTTTGPVFAHCQRGADRTGAVVAAYRIDHDHWDNARALGEAMSHKMSVFQFPRQNFIRKFQPRTMQAKAVDNAPTTTASTIDAGAIDSKMAAAATAAR